MFNCESNWQATFTTDAALASNTYTSGSGTITTSGDSSSPSSTTSGVTSTSSAPESAGPGVQNKKSSNAGLIAAATIGGIAAVALVGIAILLAIRYTSTNKKGGDAANGTAAAAGGMPPGTPGMAGMGTAPPGY